MKSPPSEVAHSVCYIQSRVHTVMFTALILAFLILGVFPHYVFPTLDEMFAKCVESDMKCIQTIHLICV